METQFKLALVNPAKSMLGLCVAFTAVFGLVAVTTSHIDNSNWAIPAAIITLLSSGFIAYKLLEWWVKYEVVVLVKTDRIVVQYVADGTETTILFTKLASYWCQFSNGWQQLHLKPIKGRKLKLSANDWFGKTGDFGGMVHAVAQATAGCRNENGTAITYVPNFLATFFEKPISTIVLVAVTLPYAFSMWKIVRGDLPFQDNMKTGTYLYIIYLAIWLATLKRRNQARL